MTDFSLFIRKIHDLKVGGSTEVGPISPNRRAAISTLQIALDRRYTSRTEGKKVILWRLK